MLKKNIIYLVVIIILIAVAIFLTIRNDNSTIKRELRDFAIEDTSAVTRIFMVNKEGTSVLLERTDDHWTVNRKYLARKDAIDLLLKTMNRLTVLSPVSNTATSEVIKRLAVKSVKVEIYSNHQLIKTYYVGGPTQDNMGTFMILEGSSVPFIVGIYGFRGYVAAKYFTNPYEWRSPHVFNETLRNISEVKVEYPQKPDKSFCIVNDNHWNIKVIDLNNNSPLKLIDTLSVKTYLSGFRKINFNRFVNNTDTLLRDSLLMRSPLAIITLKNAKAQEKQIKLYLRLAEHPEKNPEGNPYDLENLFGFLSDSSFVYVQYYVFDPLLKELNDFKPHRK